MQGMRLSQNTNTNPGFLNGVVFPKMEPSLNLTSNGDNGNQAMSNADIVNLIEVSFS